MVATETSLPAATLGHLAMAEKQYLGLTFLQVVLMVMMMMTIMMMMMRRRGIMMKVMMRMIMVILITMMMTMMTLDGSASCHL